MDYPIYDATVILLSLVLLVGIIFRLLNLPVILGYLVVGAIAGPHALGIMKHLADAQRFAEIGVIFLMFMVGLEFSLKKMIAMRKEVFLLGGLQVATTIICTAVIGRFLNMNWVTAIIIGGIVAMSSTAVVIKQLSDQGESHQRFAHNAVGILLFQDLAVIPFLIFIAELARDQPHMGIALLEALIKGVVYIFSIFIVGRWFFRPIFYAVAGTQVIELFALAVLLTALGSALFTHHLGLSFSLGAFTAGMMLGETRFKHQIATEIRPFRDPFMGLFFICIGALFDITEWRNLWEWIIFLSIAILFGKTLVIYLLSRLLGNNQATALRTSIVLAQGGEFGFAILTLALSYHLLPSPYTQVILGALLLTMAISPILISFNGKIASKIFPKNFPLSLQQQQKKIAEHEENLKDHIIILGFGTVGQNIIYLLEQKNIAYHALDLDVGRIKEASLMGKPVSYGDATHIEILKTAGAAKAKALIISFDDTESIQKILYHVNFLNPKLPTFVRCKNERELEKLKGHGATQIVVESHEESLMLTYYLFLTLRVPHKEANRIIQRARQKNHERLLQTFPPSFFPEEFSDQEISSKKLHSFVIYEDSNLVGCALSELSLEGVDVSIVALQRGQKYYPNPPLEMELQANDVLLLFGFWENLDQADSVLLTL